MPQGIEAQMATAANIMMNGLLITDDVSERCGEEGSKAFFDGNKAEANPYPLDCAEHCDWSDGWHLAWSRWAKRRQIKR